MYSFHLTDAMRESMVGPMVTEGSTISCRYCFTPDFVGFSGHFPGYPILPAFIQVLVGLDLMSQLRGGRQALAVIENAKFRLEIHPGDEVIARCTERREALYEVRLTVGGALASSFLLVPDTGKEGECC